MDLFLLDITFIFIFPFFQNPTHSGVKHEATGDRCDEQIWIY